MFYIIYAQIILKLMKASITVMKISLSFFKFWNLMNDNKLSKFPPRMKELFNSVDTSSKEKNANQLV